MKLLIASTGNITNKELLQLIDKNLETIEKLTEEFTIIEIDKLTIKANK